MRIAKLEASLRQADSSYSALCECWTGSWKRQRSQKVAHWASPSESSLRRIRGDGGICKARQFYDLERRLGANIKPLGNAPWITMSHQLPQSQETDQRTSAADNACVFMTPNYGRTGFLEFECWCFAVWCVERSSLAWKAFVPKKTLLEGMGKAAVRFIAELEKRERVQTHADRRQHEILQGRVQEQKCLSNPDVWAQIRRRALQCPPSGEKPSGNVTLAVCIAFLDLVDGRSPSRPMTRTWETAVLTIFSGPRAVVHVNPQRYLSGKAQRTVLELHTISALSKCVRLVPQHDADDKARNIVVSNKAHVLSAVRVVDRPRRRDSGQRRLHTKHHQASHHCVVPRYWSIWQGKTIL